MVTKKDRILKSKKAKNQRLRHIERAKIFAAVNHINDNKNETRWITIDHMRLEIAVWDFNIAKPGQQILCYEHGRFYVSEHMDKDGRYIYSSKAKGYTALDQIIATVKSCHDR